MKIKTTIFIFLLLIVTNIKFSSAEYRVYQYYLSQKDSKPNDPNGYVVTSTLGPVTYMTYYGGSTSIDVELLRTWICKGYTGNMQKHCKAPFEMMSTKKEKEEQKI